MSRTGTVYDGLSPTQNVDPPDDSKGRKDASDRDNGNVEIMNKTAVKFAIGECQITSKSTKQDRNSPGNVVVIANRRTTASRSVNLING